MSESRERRIRNLEERMSALAEEIAYLRSQPAEPEIGSVVAWSRTYGGATRYEYAAVRAGNGKWYVTGGKECNQGITWEQVLGLSGPRELIKPSGWITVKEGRPF